MLVHRCLLSYVEIEHCFSVSLGDGWIYGKHWQQRKLTIKESGFYHTKMVAQYPCVRQIV
jgi:hypothetical protein